MEIELLSKRRSYICIEVLPFLKGRKIDKVVMGYLHALRPSSVRVCYDMATLDSVTWRVTIWLNEDETIREIMQEVEIGIYEDVKNGLHLKCILEGRSYPKEGYATLR